MKSVTIKLELIGVYTSSTGTIRPTFVRTGRKRPYVAELKGCDERYGLLRKFLKPLADYTQANSKRSRGVFHYYHLFEGRTYEVSEHTSWYHSTKYFCWVKDGKLIEIPINEIYQWLEKHTSGRVYWWRQ